MCRNRHYVVGVIDPAADTARRVQLGSNLRQGIALGIGDRHGRGTLHEIESPPGSRLPAAVFFVKATERDLEFEAAALDAVCTKYVEITVRARLAVPVPMLFVALSATVEVPVAVGVPEIMPVVLFTVRPAGNPLAP